MFLKYYKCVYNRKNFESDHYAMTTSESQIELVSTVLVGVIPLQNNVFLHYGCLYRITSVKSQICRSICKLIDDGLIVK